MGNNHKNTWCCPNELRKWCSTGTKIDPRNNQLITTKKASKITDHYDRIKICNNQVTYLFIYYGNESGLKY